MDIIHHCPLVVYETPQMAKARELAISELNMTDREFNTLKGQYALMCQLLRIAQLENKS